MLLLAPAAAILAAGLAGQPLLAHWTQTFMGSAARFIMLAPMAHALFRAAPIPKRLMPAAIGLGTSTFTMSALLGTPAIQNAIPMPFFGTTAFAAPGLGIIASLVMLGFGLWWLGRSPRLSCARKPRRDRSKAAAEKKIIAKAKRNDGMHEINAGEALWLPVDWKSATRPLCLRQKAASGAIRNNRCAVDASPFSSASTPHSRTASISLTDEIHLFQTSLIVVFVLVRALGQFDF